MNSLKKTLLLISMILMAGLMSGCGKMTLEKLTEQSIQQMMDKKGMCDHLTLNYDNQDAELHVEADHQMIFVSLDSYADVSGEMTKDGEASQIQMEVYTEKVPEGIAKYVGADGEWHRDLYEIDTDFTNTNLSGVLELLKDPRFEAVLLEEQTDYQGHNCYVIQAKVAGQDLDLLKKRIWEFGFSSIEALSAYGETWMTDEACDLNIFIDTEDQTIRGISLNLTHGEIQLTVESYGNVAEDQVTVSNGIRAQASFAETETETEAIRSDIVMENGCYVLTPAQPENAEIILIEAPENVKLFDASEDKLLFSGSDIDVVYELYENLPAQQVKNTVADYSYLNDQDMEDYTDVTLSEEHQIQVGDQTITYVTLHYTYQADFQYTEMAAWMQVGPKRYLSVKISDFTDADAQSQITEELLMDVCAKIHCNS